MKVSSIATINPHRRQPQWLEYGVRKSLEASLQCFTKEPVFIC